MNNKNIYLKISIISILLVLILFFIFLFVSNILKLEFNTIRLDKYDIQTDILRYIVGGISLTISILIIEFKGVGKNLIFTPMLVFFLLLVFQVYPGVLLTAPNNNFGHLAVYAYSGSLILFSLGVLLSSYLAKFNAKKEIKSYYKQINFNLIGEAKYIKILTIVTVVSVLIVIFEIISNNSGSLRGILDFIQSGVVSDRADDVLESRKGYYEVESSYVDIFANYILRLILPICTITFIIAGLKENKRLYKFIGAFLFLLTILSMISTGHRLMVAQTMLIFLIIYSYIKKIKLNHIFTGAFIVLFLLVLQTITLGRMTGGEGYIENIILSLNRTLERILLTKGYVTTYVFEYFPHIESFRYGDTILQKLLGTLSSHQPLSEEMYEYIYTGKGTAGPQAFGEVYVNFGLLGMLLFAFLCGFITQMLSIAIIRKRFTEIFFIAISGYLSFLIGYSGYSDIAAFKTNGLHILIIFLLVVMIMAEVIVKKRNVPVVSYKRKKFD